MTVAPTANAGILRDAAGRAQVEAPLAAADIARLDSITAVQAGAVPNTAAGVLAARNAFLGDTSNIHPDQAMSNTPHWVALVGWAPLERPGWMHRRLLSSSAPPSTDWQTAITMFFPVEPGAQYYIRCRTWNSAAGNTFALQFASETPSTRLSEVVQMRTAMAAGGAVFEGIVTIRANTNRGQVIIDRGTGGSGAISAGDFIVRRAVTANEIAANAITAVQIIAGAVTTAKIATGAITTDRIAALAVTSDQIAANAITTAKIAAGAITADRIAANAVTSIAILAGAVTAGKIAAGAISATEIAANAITSPAIAAGAVTAEKIAANTITAGQIASNTITAGQIAAGAIGTGQLAADAVTAEKVAAGAITLRGLSQFDTGNLVTNPDMWNGQAGVASLDGWHIVGTHFLITDLAGAPSRGAVRLTPMTISNDMRTTRYFSVSPGEHYHVSCWVWLDGAFNSTFRLGLEVRDRDLLNPVWLAATTATTTGGGWQQLQGIVTIPAGSFMARLWLATLANAAPAGDSFVTKVTCRSVFRSATVPNLTQVISNPPTQAEVLAIQNTLNQLLTNMRTAHLLAP